MYTVMNAGIPVIYVVESAFIHVMCVRKHSIKRANLQCITANIVVNLLIHVMYVRRHSIKRAILQCINAHIVVNALIRVM